MIIGGIPGTSALTVNVCKNKRETLPGTGAGADLPFPEAAQ